MSNASKDAEFRRGAGNVLFNYAQGVTATEAADRLLDLYRELYSGEDKF